MKDIKINSVGKAEMIADENSLAVNVGSGSLEVFATPMMAMLMEKSACNCLEEFLDDGETTVGTELNIKHISATPRGMKVKAEAKIIEVNGREIVFDVVAYDEVDKIGSGIHKRFVVNSEKFFKKTCSKK